MLNIFIYDRKAYIKVKGKMAVVNVVREPIVVGKWKGDAAKKYIFCLSWRRESPTEQDKWKMYFL